MNNSATSWPKAPGVAESVCQSLQLIPEHPGRVVGAAADHQEECRRLLAGLLGGVDPRCVALTSNATHALNLAILGLELRAGQLVVTTVTEHNSVLRPLHHLARNRGVELEIIGLDGRGAIDHGAFVDAVERAPVLVAVNHVSNVTGRMNPVAELFAHAHARGAVTLLDASQSLGQLPVPARELEADLVAFTGHKSLLGPPGTGGLYVAEHIELGQVLTGGTGVRSDLALHPSEMPVRLEAGTPDLPAWAGLAAALRWLSANGVAHRAMALRHGAGLRQGLSSIAEVRLLDGDPAAVAGAAVSFTIQGWCVDEAAEILTGSYDIVCRSGLHCAPLIHQALGVPAAGSIRFSPGGFNTDEEISYAIRAVGELAGAA